MNKSKEDFRKLVGSTLAGLRKVSGQTQEQLAETVGFEPNYISEIERGLKLPALDSFFRLIEALHQEPHIVVREIQDRLGRS
ncbi:MAG: helix-turn-helix transcriptional regulator [Verrucomicrobia bacterium]|nr:helix-turn-helix transcriptional regulator [Verrucomicrobiota bacterium]MDA1006623.1 helix-turn-helix transcriptional regulator [Verrucomicrobiota bacterium]